MAPVRRTAGLARHLGSTKGAELIEFALVLPVLLLVLGGVLDMGFLFNNYAVVTNAAREGARMAAVPGWVETDVKNRVNRYITGAGLTLTGVTTTVNPVAVDIGGGKTVNAVKVVVTYPYNYLILGPLAQMIQGGSVANVTLKAAATMRAEVAAGL
ncbi:MAG TPA: TadE/TadG family type IV pilus assembly protein [Vicinamibacterales bacterium]|jgi:Flp pilus assembly protein TadG